MQGESEGRIQQTAQFDRSKAAGHRPRQVDTSAMRTHDHHFCLHRV